MRKRLLYRWSVPLAATGSTWICRINFVWRRASAAPRSFYDGIAATGHPIGIYLRNQQQSLQHLWIGMHAGN